MTLPAGKRNRLVNYDYSSNGAYFVTICTEGKRKTMCDIAGDGVPVPKEPGRIAERCIMEIPGKYPTVTVAAYTVMPNHIHLLLLFDALGGTGDPSPTQVKAQGPPLHECFLRKRYFKRFRYKNILSTEMTKNMRIFCDFF